MYLNSILIYPQGFKNVNTESRSYMHVSCILFLIFCPLNLSLSVLIYSW